MATIRKRHGKYEVQVRRTGQPHVSRTFIEHKDAKAWARQMEIAADRNDLPTTVDRRKMAVTLGASVGRYRDTVTVHKRGGKIERVVLNNFALRPICRKTVSELRTSDFAEYRDERLREVSPVTLKRQLNPIHHLFEIARDEWGMRQFLSEGQVRYMTVQSTKDGNVGQELPVIRGPVGLMMTTTANSLHWEDETRMLTLQVDQSPDQIKRALIAKVRGGPTQPSNQDLARWHALHDFAISGPTSVVVPYEEALLTALIVTSANAFTRAIHDRMPVLLDATHFEPWMTGEAAGEVLKPAPDSWLHMWPVSKRVNRPGHGDDPSLINEVAV